jgi:hypothetical protein
MKTFRSIVQEAAKPKSRVLLFGRMNPITRGHEENVTAAHAIAQKHDAELHVVASHSHDVKKNPLSPEQKTTHLKRAFGHLSNTHVSTSSKEAPTILHQASQAHAAGVQHLVIAGGGDRAHEYHKLLNTYNGHEGGKHGYYKFKKISIENTGERKEGVSGTDMRKHASSGNFDKFRAGLPSKIAGNEKHSRSMYDDVRKGMGVNEDNRETYVSGQRLRLGESVVDTYTGITGRIVYRGPTYVTLQIDEDLSVKRWIDDVDSLVEWDEMTDTSEFEIQPFKNFISTPADVIKHHMDRLHYCPGAQAAFRPMIGDLKHDQGTVQAAIDSTAHYLDIEEHAVNDQYIDDHGVSEFNRHFRQAGQLLSSLGVLAEHRGYMETHSHTMLELVDEIGSDNLGEAKNIDVQGHQDLTDDDYRSIEKHIDQLEQKDIEKLLDAQDEDQGAEAVDEELSAQARIKKRFDFMKSKSKREIALQLSRRRSSSQGKLKKRAINHARTLLMSRMLRGRDKSSLSAAEKNRIEAVIKNNRAGLLRISNRLLPKLRDVENKRMQRMNQRKEETDIMTAQSRLDHTMQHLTGVRPITPSNPEPNMPVTGVNAKRTMTRLKNFRKLEH